MGARDIWDTQDHITEDAVTTSATQVVPEGTVLMVARSGILARALPISIARVPVALNQDMKALLPHPGLHYAFLAYFLDARSADVLGRCVKRGATVHSLDTSKVEQLQLPLPPPSEQRRIVEILDQADALRMLRAAADAKAERILPTLFYKMFGDPVTNPMGWKVRTLGWAVERVEAGWSPNGENRGRSGDELGVLKVSAVTSGVFLPAEHKAVHLVDVTFDVVSPRKGNLLVSRANTRELIAASCLVQDDEPRLFLSDKLWRIKPNEQRTTTAFLKSLLWTQPIRDLVRKRATGTSGSMLNISQEAFLGTPAFFPPIELQRTFSSLVWQVYAARTKANQAMEKLHTLWTNLLHRAFSGDLTAKWREAHMQELLAEMEQQAREPSPGTTGESMCIKVLE